MPTTLTHVRRLAGRAAAVMLLSTVAFAGQESAVQDPAADAVKRARQQIREGRLEEALAIDQRALAAAPDSLLAHSQTGAVLDLLGRYAEARRHLTRAVALASNPRQKARALRSVAISYAFENDCTNATRYASQAYDLYRSAGDFYNAGEAADELARICLEAGDLHAAARWYRTGHDTGLQAPGISAARTDLWNFRLEHAEARIAARRGDRAAAAAHVKAAVAILDKGTNPEQKVFLPYLTGYVALYTGAPRTALADLQKANQRDPFILCLIAQAHEKLGESSEARTFYRQALAHALAHNPPTAYARPRAERKLRGTR